MTHPDPKAPGNVPLWRCRDAYKLNCDFPVTCVFAKHHDAFKVGQYSSCHVAIEVGFRTPRRCEDCEYRNSRGICDHGETCTDMYFYTPRLPGKGVKP